MAFTALLSTLRTGFSRTFWVANTIELFERFAYYGSKAILAPRYYEYVANLAPPEQVGTYMGFAFLPVAIGTFVAGALGGKLVAHYLQGAGAASPQHMWYVVGAIGVVATALMLFYDRFLAPHHEA